MLLKEYRVCMPLTVEEVYKLRSLEAFIARAGTRVQGRTRRARGGGREGEEIV